MIHSRVRRLPTVAVHVLGTERNYRRKQCLLASGISRPDRIHTQLYAGAMVSGSRREQVTFD